MHISLSSIPYKWKKKIFYNASADIPASNMFYASIYVSIYLYLWLIWDTLSVEFQLALWIDHLSWSMRFHAILWYFDCWLRYYGNRITHCNFQTRWSSNIIVTKYHNDHSSRDWCSLWGNQLVRGGFHRKWAIMRQVFHIMTSARSAIAAEPWGQDGLYWYLYSGVYL